jgi:hypothetical protein
MRKKPSALRPHTAPESPRSLGGTCRAAFKKAARLGLEVMLPASLRGLALAVAYNQAVYPLINLTYPTAEDYLRARNLDPAIAETLGAAGHHVVGPGIGNMLYENSFVPFLMPMVMNGLGLAMEPALSAHATRGFPYSLHQLTGFCQMVIPSETPMDQARMVFTVSGMQVFHSEMRKDLKIDMKALSQMIIFHEMRHCSPENDALPAQGAEADADIQAFRQIEKLYPGSEVPRAWMYLRAMNLWEYKHDVALYLDADLNGKPMPSYEDGKAAGKELLKRIDDFLDKGWFDSTTRDERVKAVNTLLDDRENPLSPLAQERARLYLDALTYLTGQPMRVPGALVPVRTVSPHP